MKHLINWTFPEKYISAAFADIESPLPERIYTPGIILTTKVLAASNFTEVVQTRSYNCEPLRLS